MESNKILIIIPAYNEESCILNTYKSIIKYNEENNTHFHIIVINDGSTDKTEQICIENNIPIISLIHNLGIGGAVQTGYKYAKDNGYDIAIQYDGDGQHDVSYIDKIVEPIRNKEADFVIGSRFINKDASDFKSSTARRVGIKIISIAIKLVTRIRILDVTSGFRAANRKIINDFATSYPVDFPEPITNTELLKKKYRVKEVPVSMNERAGGVSSIRSWKSAYFMVNVVLTVLIVGMRRVKDDS